MNKKIKILIADDFSLIRQALKNLLERQDGIEVLEDGATNGKEALEKTLSLNPDILLLDINFPDVTGLEVLSEIRKKNPEQKIIMLTMHDSKDYILESINKRANGYITKDADIELLVDAIRRVYKGDSYIQPNIFKSIIVDVNNDSSQKPTNTSTSAITDNEETSNIDTDYPPGKPLKEILTSREIEILKLVAEGKSNKDIGIELNISEKTARNHLYKKEYIFFAYTPLLCFLILIY